MKRTLNEIRENRFKEIKNHIFDMSLEVAVNAIEIEKIKTIIQSQD